jgi:AcrR family transcriptional regulator
VRERVLEAVAELISAGQDPTFARAAAASGVSERTVYRHFPSRDALMAALFDWANERIGFGGDLPSSRDAMVDMVGRVFPGFDGLAPVIDELLRTPEGRRARLASAEARRVAAEALVHDASPGLDPRTRRQLAAVIQVLGTAAVWQALRDFWEMDGREAAEAVATAIEALLRAAPTGGGDE